MMTDFFCSCCQGREATVVYTGLTSVYSTNHWTVSRCVKCDNIVTMPVPDQHLLDDIYSNTYLYPVHHLILSEKQMRAKELARFIERTIPNGKSIFEAGCMYGYLLTELQNNYRVKGIEIGEEAVDYCQRKGLDVHDSSLEHYLLNNNEKFDVIVLSHVFEHLLDCDKILKQLAERISEDGKIILLVPNSHSVSKIVFGRYWGWWQVPVHINHFSKNPLSVLAGRLGLKISFTRSMGGDSLMLLLNFINIFRFHKKATPGRMQKIIIRLWTHVFRYWYFLGNEELTVVIQKK